MLIVKYKLFNLDYVDLSIWYIVYRLFLPNLFFTWRHGQEIFFENMILNEYKMKSEFIA